MRIPSFRESTCRKFPEAIDVWSKADIAFGLNSIFNGEVI